MLWNELKIFSHNNWILYDVLPEVEVDPIRNGRTDRDPRPDLTRCPKMSSYFQEQPQLISKTKNKMWDN